MTTIGQNLSALGFAPVIAVMRRGEEGRAAATGQHFRAEPSSQLAASARASVSLAAETDRPVGPDRTDGSVGPDVGPAGTRVYPNLGVVYGTVDRAGLAALRADPDVRSVASAPQFSLIRPVTAAAAVPLTEEHTWGLRALGIPQLWAQGLTGTGVRVAHLDTGVEADHPALQAAVVLFAEFGPDGRVVPGAKPRDSDQRDAHGTHTAGTIAGRPVGGRHVGVAPAAELCSAMVIEGGDVVARILGGMDWAVGEGVRVLSMSLGLRGIVNDFLAIVDVLRANRVLPVIAIGNEGPGTSRSPGNYPRALSVGACDEQGQVVDFSSSQRFVRRSQPLVPDIVAPGSEIVSAAPNGGWQTLSGTSMATPHVAGLAALLLQARPTATVTQLERAILGSAERGTMERERVNRGAVNGPRALARLTGG